MSFRAIITATVVACAMGFAPSSRLSTSRVTLSMGMEDLPGAIAPLGFFDPVGMNMKQH
jgi:hypothetical protein